MSRALVVALVAGLAVTHGTAAAQGPPPVNVAPSAPRDRPFRLSDAGAVTEFYAFLEPCRPRALAEWPVIKLRFQSGLPARQSLFVVTRLWNESARTEQVFVVVDSLRETTIVGRIWSEIQVVDGYRVRQPIVLSDSSVVDWMISMPDGREEGNRIGKIIDELQAKGSVPANVCSR